MKKKIRFSFFGLAVSALTLLLVMLVMAALGNSRPHAYDLTVRPSSLLVTLRNGRYAEALTSVQENRAMGVTEEKDPDYAAPYAVCDYFEACSYRTACANVGDDASAARWDARMREAYGRMGSLQFMAEDIRSVLGAEE